MSKTKNNILTQKEVDGLLEDDAKSSHTPGPWTLRRVNEGRINVLNSRKICIAETTDNDEIAQLIAAAPEMLEALERLAEALPELFDPSNDEPLSGADIVDIVSQEGRNIKAVIAKAKGESQ